MFFMKLSALVWIRALLEAILNEEATVDVGAYWVDSSDHRNTDIRFYASH
jgi:hypothetical protein